MATPISDRQLRRIIYLLVLFLSTGGLAYIALTMPLTVLTGQQPLGVGDVAKQDVRAPESITYVSDLLTEEQRQQAAQAVGPVYSPTDTDIARQQLERLRVALLYISAVRADPYANDEQKLADLAALEDMRLDRETAQRIISLSNSRWQTIQQEAIVVLEQVLRTTIREDALDEARLGIPYFISLSLPEEQASIITELLWAFVTPNSVYDDTATRAARQEARISTAPVTRKYVSGETVVQSGQVISSLDLEALTQLGLAQPLYRWQDLAGAAALLLSGMALVFIYLLHNKALAAGTRRLSMLAALFLVFLFAARLTIPGHTIVPYLFPVAAYGLVVATLFGAETALVTSLPLILMVTYSLPYAFELSLYYLVSSLFGMFVLGRARRFTTYFWTGLVIALAGGVVNLAYRLPEPSMDWPGVATLGVASLVYGVASAGVALVAQFFLAQALGMTTALQLMELSRPDHPLLQLLLRNAPGTYQHSLQVANLGEQAAETIGADALLTRVGALYHDIGKTSDAVFFIENQVPGNLNPHDDLEPSVSASLIIRHVIGGIELARKYHLPRRIQDFIVEHHGTMITHYQYTKALEAMEGSPDLLNDADFQYPGPRPQSRETALIMLADSSEARVRAEHPKDESELREVIRSVVERRVSQGQLNDTDMTLNDLACIIDSFTTTLRGIYHPRIHYPGFDKLPEGQGEMPNAEGVSQAGTVPEALPPGELDNNGLPDFPAPAS